MKVQLYDFRWTDEHSCEFQGSADGRFGRKKLQIGDKISIEVCSDVRCAGSVRDEKFRPCPQDSTGKAKCDYCRSREGTFVYTAFDGFDQSNITSEDLEKISGSHVVYLALFSRDLIKIGVARLERKIMRQLEQGSHVTLFVAQTPDGVSARQIETLLRKNGIADKIRADQKKDVLCPEISDEQAETILRNIIEQKICSIDEQPHLQEFLLDPAEFQSWKPVYGLDVVERSPKTFHSVTLAPDEWVSGKIVAIKGQFLIIETPEELVSLCAKDLFGREINFDPRSEGLKISAALQHSLF